MIHGSGTAGSSHRRAGAGGPREAEVRPSDAVTLAVTSGAHPNSSQFSTGGAHDDDQESYPIAAADIAAEAEQRMREAAE
jgi:hypothetical protein